MTSRERVIESLSKAKILDLAALRGVVQELRDMSPDEVVACFLRLPANKRAVVIIDDKSPDGKGGGPHVGRRSCVICRGGLTERNQLAVPMRFTMNGTGRVMYCYVLVCGASCENRLGTSDWLSRLS